ncbi:HNH endonuclease [Sediminibacillus massiliensis]|uniref:HNH endonuclease n=1 Tax=Sediminibacillus massiliensis TaxID=1926277 RepID=UPI0009884A55|nr:HNH endonuclease signature motif containing protein [Sediminibacillus massiliensis]
MLNEFNPVPKPKHKRSTPKKKQRGAISQKEYDKTVEQHGAFCFWCGRGENLECHHVIPKGFSRYRNGRGKFRNLRFLCKEHHDQVDGSEEMRQELEQYHKTLYGPHFYKDEYDLMAEGLITDKDQFEKFMKGEEARVKRQGYSPEEW